MIRLAPPRLLNQRLWELENKRLQGTASHFDLIELDALCHALEAEQDIEPMEGGQ